MKKTILFFLTILLIYIGFLFVNNPNLPHHKPRTEKIEFIVVHSFALAVDEMIQRLDELSVSTHYIIDEEGRVIQLVDDDKVAYHAGKSYWRGQENLNESSLGIELQSKTLGQTAFSQKQIQSFKNLTQKLMQKYNIPNENVVGHSDIAPTRKVDPGKMFPWRELQIGPKDVEQGDIHQKLSQIGYDTSNLKAAILAYNRHFHPELIPTDEDIRHMEENLAQLIEDKNNPIQ
jgi:N-acetylmuramoyl-L-alanine amidase